MYGARRVGEAPGEKASRLLKQIGALLELGIGYIYIYNIIYI